MKLPILREMPYISPSSFMSWDNCNHFHYLRKLAGISYPPWMQTKNTAFGTIFDVVVKSYISTKNGWDYDRKKAWKGLAITPDMAQVIPDAIAQANAYNHSGLGFSVTSVDPVVEGSKHNEIPIFGYLDATLKGIPFDWKTTGYGTNYSASPKPGYSSCLNLSEGSMWKQRHKKCGEPLDHIDRGWATQALFYSWMLGLETPSMYVHQLVITPKRVLLAKYHAGLSDEFIEEVETKLVQMWEMSGSGEHEPPEPAPYKCKRFNQWCEAAPHCEYFKMWRDDTLAQSGGAE